jgi:high affinity Mn2+ porin
MRLALVVALLPSLAFADDTLAPHPDAKWWLSAQGNWIGQAQPGFHSPYHGPNSLLSDDNAALSFVGTVFAGYEVTPYTAIVVTGESAAGGGLSQALGLAGFSNLDVVRNPTLGSAPYVGRAFIDQVIPLGGAMVVQDRTPLRILRRVPARRIEIRAGKVATADYFDVNSVGTDSHYQFMNWTVDNSGAYDYAADTRGYTLGGVIEYAEALWAVRYGFLLMPTVANGIDYDTDLAHARGENLELEMHECIAGHAGIVRLLAFWNHARMGRYRAAIIPVEQHIVDTPEIEPTRAPGRLKYGFGANVEQELAGRVRGYARVGWNEGHFESFAYTEVDNTFAIGADIALRALDRIGIAAVSNGISEDHREYLALGGKGFILGDGKLHYGREDILEAYYTARVYRGVYPAIDVQAIAHPGYNTDRGPVVIGSVRLHVEI